MDDFDRWVKAPRGSGLPSDYFPHRPSWLTYVMVGLVWAFGFVCGIAFFAYLR